MKLIIDKYTSLYYIDYFTNQIVSITDYPLPPKSEKWDLLLHPVPHYYDIFYGGHLYKDAPQVEVVSVKCAMVGLKDLFIYVVTLDQYAQIMVRDCQVRDREVFERDAIKYIFE